MTLARELVRQIAADPTALRELAEAIAALGSSQPQERPLMDLKTAAAYLGLSADALDRRARAGIIPSIQEGPRCKRFFDSRALYGWARSANRLAQCSEGTIVFDFTRGSS